MDNETYRAELFHEPAPNNVNMPWTIERQLEAYAMHPDGLNVTRFCWIHGDS